MPLSQLARQHIPNNDWNEFLESQWQSQPFQRLLSALEERHLQGENILPPPPLWLNAFALTKLAKVKVVIIGQDPYMHPGQAMGLSFSVPQGVKVPPSLNNIYKQLEAEFGGERPAHGDLSHWAEQGVFLLNASLTVAEAQAGSHLKLGWLAFTQATLEYLNQERDGIVFLAWGAFAQKLCKDIDQSKHKVIATTHPSPLGARRPSKEAPAFLGSNCFTQTNDWLKAQDQAPIEWLPEPSQYSLI
ncbi:uracil-DNA glycosylase [Paraferrimonas sedimenticola]|uniref:Uracil-DNA glycosylase n=1 Tax=Paraferrimonas sedimenticola TaxID=375674 RepID=A0AA37RWS1_9GAMM|nr:uracil-DNA glycosylase [Paraferrimonas sedimenticola]GLP97160.1 uracil-DNA glycosylase [Paraferrimonas sedimenticola]